MERRTIGAETGEAALEEVTAILDDLAREDPEFEATARLSFSRPPYELSPEHPLPRLLVDAVESLGTRTATVGMSFWTDAAVLGAAGIPSVLFGPGGAGLHSREEYVTTRDVVTCRDALSSSRAGLVLSEPALTRSSLNQRLRALPQHQTRLERVTPGIAGVAQAGPLTRDFPPGGVVPTGRAPHHDAVALEMQHRVVAVQSADDLPERESPSAPSAPLPGLSEV